MTEGMFWQFALGAAFIFAAGTAVLLNRERTPARKADSTLARRTQVTRRLVVAAIAAMFAGNQVWRIRTVDELDSNPLDLAGLIRIALDVLAILLALAAAHRLGRDPFSSGRLSPPRLYGAYVFVVLIGMYAAREPLLVGFRAFELSVIPLVAIVTARCFSLEECLTLVKRVLYILIATALVGIPFYGTEALVPTSGGIAPFRLRGVLPALSFNTLGTFGAILVAIALGSRHRNRLALFGGLALLVATQYRTGFLCLAVMLLVYAVVRWRVAGVTVAALLTYPLYLLFASPFMTELVTRGEPISNIETLNGRTIYWARALEVAERSPIIGTGLTSGTRFEVFPSLGDYVTSTIHSTWVETYLGTGIVGLALIAGLFIQFTRSSWTIRAVTIAPLLLAALLSVRSISGTTIELANSLAMIFAIVATAAWRRAWLADETVGNKSRVDRGHIHSHPGALGNRRGAEKADIR